MIIIIITLLPKTLITLQQQRHSPTRKLTCCPWSHVLRPKKALSQCVGVTTSCPSEFPLAPNVHVSQIFRRMIMVIMRLYRGLCTDLLVFTFWLRNAPTRRRSDRSSIASNEARYLHMTSVGSDDTSATKMESAKIHTYKYNF